MDQQEDPPIVGIGASAGGVKALQAFFEVLPSNTGAAFVVIVHLVPDARSELVSILSQRTKMPVTQIDDQEQLHPNHVYVIAPDRRLRIANHTISALPFDEPRGQRAPIDLFFRSLAEQHGDGFAVILTGAGSDGAIGVKAIKEAGGVVLVQDPQEAEYASMPRSAIATEVADFVLPVRELAERLVELLAHREHLPSQPLHGDDENVRRILAHVRVRTGHDFSQYKRATVLRRIARRAQVNRMDSLNDYYAFLRETAEEAQALFGDFLISVTTFFRDQKVFQILAKDVLPEMFDGLEAGNKIRIWVPGCATGEEAYTLGILMLEELSKRDIRPEIQIFGSDLDVGALAIAREGRFPAAIEADLSEDRLRRFFTKEGDHYRVRRELRDIVLFASHSMLKDPPFSHLDMISCRNLLIYLDRDLQSQVCNTFHYGLNPGGFLLLGTSETADQPTGLFRLIDRDSRLYRSVPLPHDKRPNLPLLLGTPVIEHRAQVSHHSMPPGIGVTDAAFHRQLLERIGPPSILVDDNHRIVHLSDSAGRYIQPPGGPISADAADIVKPELRFDLRAALHRAFERNEATLTLPIPVKFNGAARPVLLHVRPLPNDNEPSHHALILFMEGGPNEHENGGALLQEGNDSAAELIHRYQEELQLAQNRLRIMREESEAANEELRASNEELQSINEEYRSTSEELETSKEELQSINEELQTVNNELKLKLESVSRAHSDLQNLMAATDVATLFLDTSLHIKRFTPRLTQLFNVTVNDEGRSITDFTHQLAYEGLAQDARIVLRDLSPIEREVRSREYDWYLVRMRPYRTLDDKIDGVVATFVDITERRRTLEAMQQSDKRLRQEVRLVELSRSPIFVWDFESGILEWNRGSEELYGYTRAEALGKAPDALLNTEVEGSSFAALRELLIKKGSWSGELQHRTKDGRALTVESYIELERIGDRSLLLESTRDVTDRKRWQQRQTLLLNELSHRIRNTLTVVQSVARQTMHHSGDKEDFTARFEGRLVALSNGHRLLVEANWEGADLANIAESQLELYRTSDDARISFEGEPVTIPADVATPLGLVFHELATNAAKYGAFSRPEGRVNLSWHVNRTDYPYRINIRWRELNGPPVSPVPKLGFGATLIRRAINSAVIDHRFEPDGVVCNMEFDLTGPTG
jgi:two-component system, chemotaxis family, CheB/CheR fusion protein